MSITLNWGSIYLTGFNSTGLHFSFSFSLFQIHQISKNFSLPPNLAIRGTPASNLHDHGYKWKLLRPTWPPPAVLAGLTFSSPNVSLFSRSLKSSCGQASGCPFSGSASQRHHQRWWPSGPHFLLNLFTLLFFFSSLCLLLNMTETHVFFFLVLISLILGFLDACKVWWFFLGWIFWVWQNVQLAIPPCSILF